MDVFHGRASFVDPWLWFSLYLLKRTVWLVCELCYSGSLHSMECFNLFPFISKLGFEIVSSLVSKGHMVHGLDVSLTRIIELGPLISLMLFTIIFPTSIYRVHILLKFFAIWHVGRLGCHAWGKLVSVSLILSIYIRDGKMIQVHLLPRAMSCYSQTSWKMFCNKFSSPMLNNDFEIITEYCVIPLSPLLHLFVELPFLPCHPKRCWHLSMRSLTEN